MTAGERIHIRAATSADAKAVHALIAKNLEEGRLLPRRLEEIIAHAPRFLVAVRRRRVVGCAELASLSGHLAEIRSLAVEASVRRQGIGGRLVAELEQRARRAGHEQLCVLTHLPEYFINFGFSIIPHVWVQEKIFTDCVNCPRFRACGQFAMVLPLEAAASTRDDVPGVPHYA